MTHNKPDCENFQPLSRMKITIFEHMLVKQSSTLNELLRINKLAIISTHKKPYFDLMSVV
uniref:Uncharacterized protein n=1 Tax=viral metagenome TaxID=1070528 RepID=A0A6M3IPV0_9ZZZZ